MSSPASLEKARSFRRPVTQLKKVSSWAISIGPSVARAATRGVSAATLSMRALISTFRAMRSLLQAHAAARPGRIIGLEHGVQREAAGAVGRQVQADEHQAARREHGA